MGPALSTTSKLLSPRAVCHRGLEPQPSSQGPSQACYSHAYCCSHV